MLRCCNRSRPCCLAFTFKWWEMVINQQADETALDCDDRAKLLLHLIVMMMVK